MATKYIVDNVPNQTINGDITINGNLSVTGSSNNIVTYKALLTQLGVQSGTDLNDFNGGLIIGETYTLLDYQSGDDFTNIANVQSGGTLSFDYTGTAPGVGYASFTGVTGTTSGLGSGATFDVYWCGTTYISISVVTSGVDYVIGETITILGTDVGGSSPENDITITITDLTPTEIGCVFIATGEAPANWGNGSTLESSGNLVATVLENKLGYDIEWVTDFMSPGFYLGFNPTTGPIYNNFNRNSTFIQVGNPTSFFGPFLLDVFAFPYNANEKDDSVFIAVFDISGITPVADALYYLPVEIQILQDTNTTPIVISGTTTSFPFTNVSVDFYCGDMFIQAFYTSGGTVVNDIPEVVNILNTDTNTSFLGTFSDDGGNIILTMVTNLETQFCANGTLTFYVFND